MKALIVTLTLFVAVSVSHAREFERNPDRFPSIGINISNGSLDGKQTETERVQNGRSNRGPAELSTNTFGFDVRFPIAQGVTLNGFYDRMSSDFDYDRQGDGSTIYSETIRLDGFRYGFGVRYYFNK